MNAKEEVTWIFPFVEHTLNILRSTREREKKIKAKKRNRDPKRGKERREKKHIGNMKKTEGIKCLVTEEK